MEDLARVDANAPMSTNIVRAADRAGQVDAIAGSLDMDFADDVSPNPAPNPSTPLSSTPSTPLSPNPTPTPTPSPKPSQVPQEVVMQVQPLVEADPKATATMKRKFLTVLVFYLRNVYPQQSAGQVGQAILKKLINLVIASFTKQTAMRIVGILVGAFFAQDKQQKTS